MRRGDLRRALALVRRRTHRGEPLRLRLYLKADCQLCEEAERALHRAALSTHMVIERVDILAAPADVHDRYALRIPVIALGTEELDAAGLDDAGIMRWLRAGSRQGRAT